MNVGGLVKRFFLTLMAVMTLCVLLPAQTKQSGSKAKPNGTVKTATPAPAAEPVFTKTLGSPDAPITIEVYTDFECPGCRELYQRTLRRVIDDYVNQNKVYLVHRDYPLPNHKFSRQAARWAVAAATIGKYESVTEALYTSQTTWSVSGNIEPVVAGVLSLPEMVKVKQAMQTYAGKIDAHIEQDVMQAQINQVRQTPTIFIKHKGTVFPHAGFVHYTVLRAFLEERLTSK
jgi:protein-disulfide isomerase